MKAKSWLITAAFLCGLTALMFFWACPPAFALNFLKTTVTLDGLHDQKYAINDRGQVAWVGMVGGVEQIFLYQNGQNLQITSNTAGNYYLQSLQINNLGQIAWSQNDLPSGNTNVYLYDGGSYSQISAFHSEEGWLNAFPHLNNRGEVAWIQRYLYDLVNDSWDVILYSGGVRTHLTYDLVQQQPPRLNDNGWVTWAAYTDESETDLRVFLYDGAFTQIIASMSGLCLAPQINNANQVAWLNYNGGAAPAGNIYLWNNGVNTRITNLDGTNYDNTALNAYPFELNNAGQIAWSWAASPAPRQIYLYSGGTVSKLTDSTRSLECCRLRDNGWLAWKKLMTASSYDLFVYRGGSATLIDQGMDLDPYLNSRGQVVWGSYYPIFLASPVLNLPGVNGLLLN